MQNNILEDFLHLLEDVFRGGNIDIDYFLEMARSDGNYFSENTRRIEYNYTDEKSGENFEYSVKYEDFFNNKMNMQFLSILNTLGDTEINIDIYEEWINIYAKLKYYSEAFLETLDKENIDNEFVSIVSNIYEKINSLSVYMNTRIKLTRFYDKNNKIDLVSKNNEKIQLKITAREFACIVRLMKEEKIIGNTNNSLIVRVVLNSFMFGDKENCDEKYFNNMFYSCLAKEEVKVELLKEVRSKFQRMIQIINSKI